MVVDFEAQIRDLQQKRKHIDANDVPADNRVGLGQEGHYDSDIYEGSVGISRFEGYLDSIPATDDQEVSCLMPLLAFYGTPHLKSVVAAPKCVKLNVNIQFFAHDSIYAIGRICYRNSVWTSGRLAVWPSDTRVDCTKTVEARIMKLTPQGSPMTVVF